MFTDIKHLTEKDARDIAPVTNARGFRLTTVPIQIYTTLLLLFILGFTYIFSLKLSAPLSEELVAPGVILCYVFALQINEQRAKRLADYNENPNQH